MYPSRGYASLLHWVCRVVGLCADMSAVGPAACVAAALSIQGILIHINEHQYAVCSTFGSTFFV